MMFNALVYKNWCLFRRRYVFPVLSIVWPCIFLVAIMKFFYTKHDQSFMALQQDSITYDSLKLDDFSLPFSSIAYTPKNKFTEQIMGYIRRKNSLVAIYPLEKEEDIEKWFIANRIKMSNNTHDVSPYYHYAVVFNVVENATEPPQNFSYTIRTDNYIPTDSLFPKYEVPGPMEAGGLYIRDGFAGLKISLDEAFLEEIGANKVNWFVQEFPYPSYVTYDTSDEQTYKVYLPFILFFSFSCLWIQAAQLSSEERMSGMIERMKLCGMNDFYIPLNYIIYSIPGQIISTIFFTILLIFPTVKNGAILENLNFFQLWIILFLLCLHSILYCLTVSAMLNNATLRQVVLIGSYFFIFMLAIATSSNSSVTTKVLGNMIAPFSLVHVSKGLVAYNSNTNFSLSSYHDSELPLMVIVICMIFGSIIKLMVFVYLVNINPGPYGSSKPFYYILPKKIYSYLKISPDSLLNSDDNERKLRSGIYENVSGDIKVGLKVINLTKKYGLFTSVESLSLDIYVGQITVLLGHNGAGKTTTLSMLSGILSPTSGSALYEGRDIFTNLKEFRKDLGLCPQSDLLHVNLSVNEHLIFFGMLKGLSKEEACKQADIVLNEVGLSTKKNSVINALSGGMKRKLCIALAMIGEPKVVILDEPTSGLDPESRREIWNILLRSRGKRMTLVSTHFMEEADVLGDQIAILNHGKISCYGTPLFLKKLYGAGYHITVSYSDPDKRNSIVQIVTLKIPEATIHNKNDKDDSVKFNLPFLKIEEFPELFKSLETNLDLEISRIGITCTTMEDVFLKVLEEAERTGIPTTKNMVKEFNETATQNIDRGLNAYMGRFFELVIKNIKSSSRRWIPTVLVLILVPVMISNMAIDSIYDYALKNSELETFNLPFDLRIYGPSEVLVFGGNNTVMKNAFLSLVKKEGSSSVIISNDPTESNNTIISELLKIGAADEVKFRKDMIVAADFSGSSPNLLYSSIASHAPMIALNLLYNTILQSSNTTSKYTIKTRSHPVGSSLGLCDSDSGESIVIFNWVATIALSLTIVCSCCIKYVHEERISSLKHLILMSDVSPLSYWMSFFVWDFIRYFIAVSIIMITFFIMGSSNIFAVENGIGILILIFFLFGISMIWLTYLVTFLFKSSISVLTMYFSVILTLGYLLFAVYILIVPQNENYAILLRLNPPTALMIALFNFTGKVLLKLKCMHCPPSSTKGIDCYEISHSSYFTKELNVSLIALGTIWLLFMLIIVLKDYGVFSFLWNMFNSSVVGRVEAISLRNVESDVAKEKDRVDAARNLTDEEGAPIVIVDSLAKKYSRSTTAVYDVSFTCKEGECFGLLGVNGAGKTTTFNILSGKILPTQGNALIKGYSLKNNKRKCLSYMGYCPQFSALIDDLTGKEMLTLFAKLRLIPPKKVQSTVSHWIRVLGLEEYQNKPCGFYSGGNKRKLSTALAFIGNPNIILLDEPSSGVDPMIRRNLWDVISANKNQAIIISSHSMNECEAVCERLTIMAEGQMKCFGSVEHLKSIYGQGYVIMIKLNIDSKKELGALKNEMLQRFESKCDLKDEHQGLLHYVIENHFYQLSFLFDSMASLKKKFDLINDYMISDSSLEQIFLSFAKKQVT